MYYGSYSHRYEILERDDAGLSLQAEAVGSLSVAPPDLLFDLWVILAEDLDCIHDGLHRARPLAHWPVAAKDQSIFAEAVEQRKERGLIVLWIFGRWLLRSRFHVARHLHIDLWMGCQQSHGFDPHRIRRLPVDGHVGHVIDHDPQLRGHGGDTGHPFGLLLAVDEHVQRQITGGKVTDGRIDGGGLPIEVAATEADAEKQDIVSVFSQMLRKLVPGIDVSVKFTTSGVPPSFISAEKSAVGVSISYCVASVI